MRRAQGQRGGQLGCSGELTLCSPVVGGGDALETLLAGSVPPGGGGVGGEGGTAGVCGEGAGTYSQLQAEGHPQHLKPLHLEIHPDGRLVVLIKSVLAESAVVRGISTSPDVPTARGLSAPLTPGSAQHQAQPRVLLPFGGEGSLSPLAIPFQASPWLPLPVDQARLPHRQIAHHDDLGNLEPAARGTRGSAEWGALQG